MFVVLHQTLLFLQANGVKKQKSLNKLKHLTVALLTNKSGTIVYDYQTSNMGSNSVKNICRHSLQKINKLELKMLNNIDASCHAETGLLKRMFRNLSKNNKKPKLNKYSLIVFRYDSQGNLVNAKPCSVCCPIIKASGIKNIWYSNNGSYEFIDGRSITGEDSSGTRLLKELNNI